MKEIGIIFENDGSYKAHHYATKLEASDPDVYMACFKLGQLVQKANEQYVYSEGLSRPGCM